MFFSVRLCPCRNMSNLLSVSEAPKELTGAVNNLGDRFGKMEVRLDNKLVKVAGEVGKLGTKVERLEGGTGRVNHHIGNLVEGQLRQVCQGRPSALKNCCKFLLAQWLQHSKGLCKRYKVVQDRSCTR